MVDERIAKFEVLSKRRFGAYLLGSSRTAMIPGAALAQLTGVSAYNASFSSATAEEYAQYVSYILRTNPNVRHIVIGLDLFAFSDTFRSYGNMPAGLRDSTPPPLTFLPEQFSLSEFWRSVLVLMFNLRGLEPEMTIASDGERHYAAYEKALAEEGDALRAHIEQEVLRGPVRWQKITKIDEGRFRKLREISEACARAGVQLTLFTNPLFVEYWQDASAPELRLYRQLLERTVREVGPIHDFSVGYELNRDPANFFNKSHFSPKLGVRALANALGARSDYGRRLTAENIENSLPPVWHDVPLR